MIKKITIPFVTLTLFSGCAPHVDVNPYVPSLRYTDDHISHTTPAQLASEADNAHTRARLYMADGQAPAEQPQLYPDRALSAKPTLLTNDPALPGDVAVFRNPEQQKASYRGPLEYGEPGVSASLWRENRGGNELFRDYRAYQPMDIITIVVLEKDRGTHNANTNTKAEATYQAAIENLLALENKVATWRDKDKPDLANLINATSANEYKGEGQTQRRGELTAKISAVIVEVLPSGLLRIEGEKIVSVNDEEQVMVVSGLVRQRDISSDNEIKSSQIAQMRIDYFGKGTVGEVQSAGWLYRILQRIWPF